MIFKLERIEEQVKMMVTIESDKWKKALNKAEKNQMDSITVPGFRKGKAPLELIKKHVSVEKVTTEAINSLTDEAYRFAMGQEEVLKLKLVSAPKLSVKEIADDKVILEFTSDVLPEVKLGDYKSIKITPEKIEVTDTDIENVLSQITKQFAIQTPKDGPIQKGDLAIFNFEGFKDGIPFEGGKAENYELVIGSGQFIPGFEDQMIGLKAGDSHDIYVSFPHNYQVANLAGAPVMFKVKINTVKLMTEARTDETAKKVGIKGVETWSALINRVKEDIFKQKEMNAKQKAEIEIMEKIVDQLDMKIPSSMLESEKENLFQQFVSHLKQQNMELDKYYENTGLTKSQILANLEKDAIARIKTSFALGEIAQIENISVNQEELINHYSQLSVQYGMDVEMIKKSIPEDSLKFRIQNQKVVNYLYENATKK